MKPAILTPVAARDTITITIEHMPASGAANMGLAVQRIQFLGADGNPLAQPIEGPIDHLSVLRILIAMAETVSKQIGEIQEQQQMQQQFLVPGGRA